MARKTNEVLWSKVLKSYFPTWALEMLQGTQGCDVVINADSVMWRFRSLYTHLEMTIDKVLSYAKGGNILDHRTYTEID